MTSCRASSTRERRAVGRSDAAASGFTLIELLIVIAILGVLVAVLLPNITGTRDSANSMATSALMLRLKTGCERFVQKHGYYPPDDLQPKADSKLPFKGDNGLNTGIESLVAFLSQGKQDGEDLSDLGGSLTNTDQDQHPAVLPLLQRKDRVEVADAWGLPLAYFSKTTTTLGFDKEQQILGSAGPVPARARRNASGGYLGGGKFQLLSAGKDGLFGTDDDVSFPEQ